MKPRYVKPTIKIKPLYGELWNYRVSLEDSSGRQVGGTRKADYRVAAYFKGRSIRRRHVKAVKKLAR